MNCTECGKEIKENEVQRDTSETTDLAKEPKTKYRSYEATGYFHEDCLKTRLESRKFGIEERLKHLEHA